MKSFVTFVRSLVFNIVFVFWASVPIILFSWVVILPKPYLLLGTRAWQYAFVFFQRTILGLNYRVVGRENLPEGPCIVASKHQSAWETCLLHLLFDDPAIVLKKELTQVPFWGWFAWGLKLIPIDRKAGSRAIGIMMQAARQAVKDGRKIVIYPQGTRLKPGVRKPYKSGIAGLYQELDLPIVPMALNSGLFWPKNSFLKKSGTITVEFLPPIPPGLARSEMMRRLEAELEPACDRLAGL